MRRYKPVRAAARLVLDNASQGHAYHTAVSAAAPSPVQEEAADEHAELSDAYKRRIQEMHQAAAAPLTQPDKPQHDPHRLPSLTEVADRLNSNRGASCSSSTSSTTDANTGIDWREALARLQVAEKQRLQKNMLTDTFRCCPPSVVTL